MQTSTDLLANVQTHGIRFLRDSTCRMLHVAIPPRMRRATLDVVAGLGQRPEARGPLLVLDAGHHEGTDPWTECGAEIRERYAAWRSGQQGARGGWGALPDSPAGRGLVGFAEQLGQVVLARPTDTAEILAVLVPTPSTPAAGWGEVMGLLVNSQRLQAVRWIVVELGASTLDAETRVKGRVAVVRPPADGIAWPSMTPSFSVDVSPGSGARPNGLVPPPRPRGSMYESPESGVQRSALVAHHALAGADALNVGRTDEAIEQQCRARDHASEGNDVATTVAMEIVLSGHLLAAGAATQAESSLARAVGIANEAGDLELTAVALLALGSTRMVRGDKPSALVAFADGAARADEARSSMLAVEACRLTGGVAVELGMEAQAVAFWSRAIKYGRSDPAVASSSSVERCARALRSLCEQRGLQAEAPASQSPEPSSTAPVRAWSEDERKSLTRSTRFVIDDEATALLTSEEIASLHGWADLPAPRDEFSRTLVLDSGKAPDLGDLLAGDTQWLDPDELERMRKALPRSLSRPPDRPP